MRSQQAAHGARCDYILARSHDDDPHPRLAQPDIGVGRHGGIALLVEVAYYNAEERREGIAAYLASRG